MLTALRYLKAGDHELSLPVYLFICSGDSLLCKIMARKENWNFALKLLSRSELKHLCRCTHYMALIASLAKQRLFLVHCNDL